jgi:hypothetical protein
MRHFGVVEVRERCYAEHGKRLVILHTELIGMVETEQNVYFVYQAMAVERVHTFPWRVASDHKDPLVRS